jgi:transcriptional regulator with XRE-family HTH domain
VLAGCGLWQEGGMTAFAQSLKAWRSLRRFSQLDLALEAGVSARHLSFLETGRARPSREAVGRLGEALSLPLDARNQLLVQAGFAPRYPARRLDSAAMAPIRQAVEHLLAVHMPWPALALDRLWRVVRMNPAAQVLFAALGVGEGDSLLDLMMSPQLPALVENWPEVARHSALRLRTESIAQGGVPELDRACQVLSEAAAAAAKPRGGIASDPAPGAVVPTILQLGGQRLALFATIAQFGTPEDVTLDDLKIELYFPLDDASASVLRALAGSVPEAPVPEAQIPDHSGAADGNV